MATASVRYAPEDPSLPKPWKGLVDGRTGNLYFWNPETNVTQYERPAASSGVSSVPSENVLGSSVQKDPQCRGYQEASRYSNDGSAKFASGPGADQSARNRSDHTLTDPDVTKQAVQLVHKPVESKGADTGLSVEAYCRRHEISVTGGNVPKPFISFQATGFPSEILREVRYLLQGGAKCRTLRPSFWDFLAQQAGFSAPTPIQAQSWPIAIQGRDIVAIAKTGSGKTLGYLIPGFIHLQQKRNNPKLGPTILVLSPTRELATQIQDEAVKFGKSSRISCTCLYGGAPKGPQIKDLDRGVDIVVATPGRLNDLLEMKRVYLHQISYLVLDEADRMLDMGFEPQIRKIVKEVPPRRQTLMYTATWPKEVRKIAADLLVNPVQVNIGNTDELVANKSITQHVEVLSQMDKRRRLEQILRSQEPGSRIIIFCSTKKMCDIIAENLNRQFGAVAIHGDKSQDQRDHVLSQFRTGRSPVLVATDVAARGLDVKDIRVVVNYDFPTGIEDYVHRIGRTGRAGATGEAYTFFGDKDARHASDLVKILEGANQNVPAELRSMASQGGGMGRGRRQWGSGPSGHDVGFSGRYDSSYGGRSGGRGGGWGAPSSPDGGFHSGRDSEQQDSYGPGSFGRDSNATGGFHQKSFHEMMMAAGATKHRDRSRSRSPNRNSEWADNSSSGQKFDGAATTQRSFHETMMEVARPPLSSDARASPNHNSDTVDCKSSDDPQNHCQKSPFSPGVQEDAAARSSPIQLGTEQLDHEQNCNKEDGTSIEPLKEEQPACV